MARASFLVSTNVELPNLIGQSEKIREVCRRIGQVAPTDATVLIQGESGTGKELVAAAIHFHSRRSNRPFIKVNCAALPESLIESELFGHVRGAFTGAVRDRKGRFAEAEGGTILLDEVSSLPLASQAKLLRVLQEKEFALVGASSSLKANVRVVASCNVDLLKTVQANAFREDLFYRLNVFPITLPPLRERKEDLPLLVAHFIRQYSRLGNRQVRGICPEALEMLSAYHWPGNVRELENAIEHALIVEQTNMIQCTSLPLSATDQLRQMHKQVKFIPLRERLRLCENLAIEEALAQSHGLKCQAAQLLGVHPKNFAYLLRKHHRKTH